MWGILWKTGITRWKLLQCTLTIHAVFTGCLAYLAFKTLVSVGICRISAVSKLKSFIFSDNMLPGPIITPLASNLYQHCAIWLHFFFAGASLLSFYIGFLKNYALPINTWTAITSEVRCFWSSLEKIALHLNNTGGKTMFTIGSNNKRKSWNKSPQIRGRTWSKHQDWLALVITPSHLSFLLFCSI